MTDWRFEASDRPDRASPCALGAMLRASALALALALGACSTDEGMVRGAVIDDKTLAQIQPGASAEQVILVMGTPSTVSTVGGQAYYYISQRVSRRYQFMQERVTDQRVVAIYLDKNNKVERVANYGLEDGKVFDFISRTTPTGGQDLSFLRQVLSRIGPVLPF